MRASLLIVLCFALAAAAHADHSSDAEQQGAIDVGVALDPDSQSGHASASVRIHARPEVVGGLIKSCAEALRMVPGLLSCEVLKTAPDESWQIIRQVVSYSWLVPKLTYEIRATYEDHTRVSIERISGDLRVLKGSWRLESDGADTVAHYDMELAPGFWVPHWLIRVALRHDLPKMLSALRTRAEYVQERESSVPGSP